MARVWRSRARAFRARRVWLPAVTMYWRRTRRPRAAAAPREPRMVPSAAVTPGVRTETHHYRAHDSRAVFTERLLASTDHERIVCRTETRTLRTVERHLRVCGRRAIAASTAAPTFAPVAGAPAQRHRGVAAIRLERVSVTRVRDASRAAAVLPAIVRQPVQVTVARTDLRTIVAARRTARRLPPAAARDNVEPATPRRPLACVAHPRGGSPQAPRREAAVAAFAGAVPLTWRAAPGRETDRVETPLLAAARSTRRAPDADASNERHDAARAAAGREPVRPRPDSQLFEPATMDRLADNIMHRLDRRMRIERERRGL